MSRDVITRALILVGVVVLVCNDLWVLTGELLMAHYTPLLSLGPSAPKTLLLNRGGRD